RVVALSVEVSPTGACITINGRKAGCGPFAHDVYAAPGALHIVASADGHESAATDVPGSLPGGRVPVKLTLKVPSAVPPPVVPEAPKDTATAFPAWPAIATGTLALVVLVTGAGLWGSHSSARDDQLE